MRFRPTTRLIMGAAGLALLLAASAQGAKDRNDPISQKIDKERKTLEVLRHQIQEQHHRATEAERRKESVLQTIHELDSRLATSREAYREVTKDLREKDRVLASITETLAQLRGRMAQRRASVQARVRVQYMEGRYGHLKTMLAARTPADFQRRFQYLSAISKREYDLMQGYRTDVAQLEVTEGRLADARAEMLAAKQQTERQLGEVKDLKQEKWRLVAGISREKETYEKTAEELQRSAARVDSLLRELEERKRVASVGKPRRDIRLPPGPKGVLPWPVDGEVVSYFGKQKHPTFETYIQRKGIEIRTSEGAAIHAVLEGTVAYADWLKGYGLVLILDHPNGFFSLYAHASKLLVKPGEQVRSGQRIGEAGDTGMTGDSKLYFELRDGAEPVDPLVWLAKRG